jgi:hypothetical protein
MNTKELRDIVEGVRGILYAPIINIILIIGFILIVLSFCEFDGISHFSLTHSPNWIMLIIGILLVMISFGTYVLTREDRRIDKKASIRKGISFSFDQLSVHLKEGKIQEVPQLSKDCAVVLPANTSFIDDCITDEKSALGAFFLKYHADKIPRAPQDFESQLKQLGYQRSENGAYPLSTTIILPQEYDTPAKTIITASSVRKETSGIRAEPSSICECIRKVFTVTADKKISKIYMPILGSGYGGLDINSALLFLLLSIRHYANHYHHLKSINIIVTESDATRLKEVHRLQYLMFLGGMGK